MFDTHDTVERRIAKGVAAHITGYMAYTAGGDGDDETTDEAREPMVKHRHDRKSEDRNVDGNGHGYDDDRRRTKAKVSGDATVGAGADDEDDDVSIDNPW